MSGKITGNEPTVAVATTQTPEGTLSLSRDALVTGSPAPARVADIRILAEVHALDVAGNLQTHCMAARHPPAL